eukprot:446364_1
MLQHKISTFISIYIFAAIFIQHLKSDEYIYVSKNGTNVHQCGSTMNNTCGTMYYASTLLDLLNDVTTIYIIDGQNETEIQLYINNITDINNNNTNYYHPCLPKKGILTKMEFSAIYKYTIIFDESYITKMEHWYPSICDNQNLTNAIIKSGYHTFFDVFSTDTHSLTYSWSRTANFINLIVSNYHFQNLSFIEYGKYYSLIPFDLNCYNCQFVNISFSCSNLIRARQITFINATISNVFVLQSSENYESIMFNATGYTNANGYGEHSIIRFENVEISDMYMQTSLFKTEYTHIFFNNCIFNNINTGYDIFGERDGLNYVIHVMNSNFSYIYPSIYSFGADRIHKDIFSQISFVNVNFIINNVAMDNYPVFNIDKATVIRFENVSVYYEYNISKHCNIQTLLGVPLVVSNTVICGCQSQQTFIKSYGGSEFVNILFKLEILE